MSEPEFLELAQILDLHQASLKAYGGLAGVRDEDGLHSAAMQPRNDYYYGGTDLFGIAAAYAFHLAQSQAFFDGNKRTAIASATVFLEMHGYDTTCEAKTLYDAMIAIAEKRLDKAGLAALFRELFA